MPGSPIVEGLDLYLRLYDSLQEANWKIVPHLHRNRITELRVKAGCSAPSAVGVIL